MPLLKLARADVNSFGKTIRLRVILARQVEIMTCRKRVQSPLREQRVLIALHRLALHEIADGRVVLDDVLDQPILKKAQRFGIHRGAASIWAMPTRYSSRQLKKIIAWIPFLRVRHLPGSRCWD